MIPQRVLDRFWQRVDISGPDECWLWRLSVGSHGYGQLGWSIGGRTRMALAHRVAWIAIHGEIADALTIDHLCHNRTCCNPAHLRLLTRKEHGRIDGLRENFQGAKTHCPAGHPYDEMNTYLHPNGGRVCRTCRRDNYWRRKVA